MTVHGARRRRPREKPKQGRIKCVVWDLDNTVWDGVLLEDGEVTSAPAAVVADPQTLDSGASCNSIASRNDHDAAMAKLRELGLDEKFLYPQINWNSKSESIRQIATDDQPRPGRLRLRRRPGVRARRGGVTRCPR